MADNRANLTEALRDWEQHQQDQLTLGLALVQRWADLFPCGAVAFRLVRLAPESNTLLRWRSSGRGQRSTRGGRFELHTEPALFLDLPPTVRARVLEFERRRIQINFDYAVSSYRVQRLRALNAQLQALAELRRQHRVRIEEETPAVAR